MRKTELKLQLKGYGLTTAHILYRMPDYPTVLQSYVWQEYDIAPDFPRMQDFLAFWQRKLDGPIHSVEYAHKRLIGPGEWRRIEGQFFLN